jgi:hypothetical protein
VRLRRPFRKKRGVVVTVLFCCFAKQRSTAFLLVPHVPTCRDRGVLLSFFSQRTKKMRRRERGGAFCRKRQFPFLTRIKA